jgi:hypothetical protein
MSKAPDLSAFPIPRKGAARPIEAAEDVQRDEGVERGGGLAPQPTPAALSSVKSRQAVTQESAEREASPLSIPSPQVSTGRLLATTVKLDEDRYLRLQEAGRPIPGRPRRRTTQEILTEALDEWLAKRGL